MITTFSKSCAKKSRNHLGFALVIFNPLFSYKKVGFCSTFLKVDIYKTMFLRHYIQQNVPTVSILLFIILFGMIQFMKPAFLYNKDGSIREFGVGYKNKTILPIWLLSLILGILSYLAVMYFVAYPRFL